MKVLLIDDDQDTQNIFGIVMEQNNLDYQVCSDGQTGLDYLRNNDADIVVIDIRLPDINGFETLDQIREEALAPNSKFVATTAYHTSDSRDEAINQGFDAFLPKPLTPSALMNDLRKLI